MTKRTHEFHLVDPSPMPILTSFSLLLLCVGIVLSIHKYEFFGIKHSYFSILALGLASVLYSAYRWWADVIKEGIKDKAHNLTVRQGLSLGMMLFILSEIMFFVVFFWSLFKFSLYPGHVLDDIWATSKTVSWPPSNMETIDPWNFPLLNTLLLLLSGTTVTWAHHALLNNNKKELLQGLLCTVILGVTFSLIQGFEYMHAEFKFKDNHYTSVFYMLTGFHGFHVIIGTIFLLICYFRAKKDHFIPGNGHLGFEFAAWYWHFVDAVWLLVFAFLYIWSS